MVRVKVSITDRSMARFRNRVRVSYRVRVNVRPRVKMRFWTKAIS
jgi:hypothetical protein